MSPMIPWHDDSCGGADGAAAASDASAQDSVYADVGFHRVPVDRLPIAFRIRVW